MLILILIDVQYSQTTAFSFEKGSKDQNHSSTGFRLKRTVTLCWNLGSEHLLTNTLLTKLQGQFIELYTVLLFFFLFNILEN